nr:DUF6519 domain-containing protein [Crocosphaera sp.]
MKGDITRLTFDPKKHYTSVRMQQGRLQLDADWNEQVDIENHLRRAQIQASLGSDNGVPSYNPETQEAKPDSFQLTIIDQGIDTGKDIQIRPGHLYIKGTLCELELGTPFDATIKESQTKKLRVEVSSLVIDGREIEANQWLEEINEEKGEQEQKRYQIETVDRQKRTLTLITTEESDKKIIKLRRLSTYKTQPDYINPPTNLPSGFYLAYIDVWERHITTIEDNSLREIALNSPDTTTRSKTVWQLKLLNIQVEEESEESTDFINELKTNSQQIWREFVANNNSRFTEAKMNACALLCGNVGASFSSRTGYQRLENQLYRVEIHQSGTIGDDTSPTFKWSRENGSIVSPIVGKIEGNTINIKPSNRDAWNAAQPGQQWIEITNEELDLKGNPGVLAPINRVISGTKIEFGSPTNTLPENPTKVRRWDGEEIEIKSQEWIDLEGGIKVKFSSNLAYETGDYWLIPARTATNDIEWPNDNGEPAIPIPQTPRGIVHNYAPLGLVKVKKVDEESIFEGFQQADQTNQILDRRTKFPALQNSFDKESGGTINGKVTIDNTLTVTNQSTFSTVNITDTLAVTNQSTFSTVNITDTLAVTNQSTFST